MDDSTKYKYNKNEILCTTEVPLELVSLFVDPQQQRWVTAHHPGPESHRYYRIHRDVILYVNPKYIVIEFGSEPVADNKVILVKNESHDKTITPIISDSTKDIRIFKVFEDRTIFEKEGEYFSLTNEQMDKIVLFINQLREYYNETK